MDQTVNAQFLSASCLPPFSGIYDTKVFRLSAGGYDNTRQFQDILGQTGIMPVLLYYRLW
jgi:hypothetical protein